MIGSVELKVRIASKELKVKAFVGKKLALPIIFGTDVLHNFGLNLLFNQGYLQIGEDKVPMYSQEQLSPKCARSPSNVTLKPKSQMIIIVERKGLQQGTELVESHFESRVSVPESVSSETSPMIRLNILSRQKVHTHHELS